jgi:glycine cleavage system aminomethyltransferase T
VRPEFESPGTKVEIEIFGTRQSATIGLEPLFDPKNDRLRS